MSNTPLNLALRFMLELAMLAALGVAGWSLGQGAFGYLLAVGLPLIAAALWGVFRVPNDGGKPVVQVAGIVRLLLEAILFSAATVGLVLAGRSTAAALLGGITLLHYLISWDRVGRLLRQ